MNKIYFHQLECYQSLSEQEKNHKLYEPNGKFDLDRLPNDSLKNELAIFIFDRGKKISFLSVRAERTPFNHICSFLRECCPHMDTFVNADWDELEKQCKIWHLRHGKELTCKRYRISYGKDTFEKSPILTYLKKVYVYFNPFDITFRYEADIWYLANIPILIRNNPVHETQSISFAKIIQSEMRDEIKDVIYLHLSQKTLGTVLCELTAINRFSSFLHFRFPDISSMKELNRSVIERYLEYLKTEATERKCFASDISHLKSLFVSAGIVLENALLESLIQNDDIVKKEAVLYKTYSEAELKRLNDAIATHLDPQVARALFLHQMLGTRISETLTLKRNCIYKTEDGNYCIRIYQTKTRKQYQKPINDDIRLLINRACEYTAEKYGITEYIFVRDGIPEKPMSYSRIQSSLMSLINKYNLCDDYGKHFTVGTT